MRLFSLLCTAATAAAAAISHDVRQSSPIAVSESVPNNAGDPVLAPFVSYSIEFAFFPDYAGMLRSIHGGFWLKADQDLEEITRILTFSPTNCWTISLKSKGLNLIFASVGIHSMYMLLSCRLHASKAERNATRDYALYNASLKTATNGTIIPSKSTDYPYILYIGPSFFESYNTWPGTKFSHGFNLAKNDSAALESLLATVPLACKALRGGKLAYWELGNEPDLYKTSAQGVVRPATWTEQDYVNEWLTKSRQIRTAMAQACPELATDAAYKYLAPSFGGVSNSLKPVTTWKDGLDTDHDIALNSEHK
jgi:hypothetical protein